MAGYSPKSLVDKLGIKEGRKALFISSPSDYPATLGKLPPLSIKVEATAAKAQSKTIAKKSPFDFIQAFCREEVELAKLFPAIKAMLAFDGMVWISWPKQIKGAKSPGPNALNEACVRETGLKIGLVDVKVCAVDETWSGLKFMYRVKDRP